MDVATRILPFFSLQRVNESNKKLVENGISHLVFAVNFIDGKNHVSDSRAIMHARDVKNSDGAGRPTAGENRTYLYCM